MSGTHSAGRRQARWAALRRYQAEPADGRDAAPVGSRFGRWIKGLDPGGKRSTSALAPNGPTP